MAVIRLDALGDTLLSTPALALLRQHLPQAEVLALAHGPGVPVLQPLCSVVEVSPRDGWRVLARHLRQFQPDAVLCFCEKRRAALAAWSSGARLRIGFDPGWLQPLRALAARCWFQRSLPEQPRHETERYAALVGLLLGSEPGEVPPIQLQPEAAHYERARALGELPPLGVQLTPKWCRFGYTVQHLRQWLAALPQPWMGLVGPAEVEWARTHFPDTPLYAGRDLLEYAAVLERLRLLVSIDTGAVHVAAARGVPVVDVFPEQNHQHCVHRWRPWRTPHRVVLQAGFSEQASQQLADDLRGAVEELWNEPS